jgi:hypothetical protein
MGNGSKSSPWDEYPWVGSPPGNPVHGYPLRTLVILDRASDIKPRQHFRSRERPEPENPVCYILLLLAHRLRKLISSRQPHLLVGRPFYNLLANIASFRLPRETYLGKKLQGIRELKSFRSRQASKNKSKSKNKNKSKTS